MTKRIGNKDEAQRRSKREKEDARRMNKARELQKQLLARAKYRNQVKGQPPVNLSAPTA